MRGLDDAFTFFGSRYSNLAAHQERVQPLVFYNWVPGYEQTVQAINSATNSAAMAAESTCALFSEFASDLGRSGIALVVATAPLPEAYELPDMVKTAVQDSGARLHQSGATLRLERERFPDDYHLDAAGARAFTADVLPVVLSALSPTAAP
jgi:hypothetical protein